MKKTTNQNIEKVCFIAFIAFFLVMIAYSIIEIIVQSTEVATLALIVVSAQLIPLILLFIYAVQKEKKQMLAIIGLGLLALCELAISIILKISSRIFLVSMFSNPYGGLIDSLLFTALIILVLIPCNGKWIDIVTIIFMSLSFLGVCICLAELIVYFIRFSKEIEIVLLLTIGCCELIFWHIAICLFLLLYKRKWSHQEIKIKNKTKNSLQHAEKNSYDETTTLN